MNRIPPQVRAALVTTATALLAQFGAGSAEVENGVDALLASVSGKGKTDRDPDRMLTAAEVAERLGRCTKTVRLLARSGKIRRICLGVGGRRASGYSEKSVEQFLSGVKEG